jgi:hypothetical protein
MRRITITLTAVASFLLLSFSSAPASAAINVGGDLIWIPASTASLDRSGVDADHSRSSFGLSAHYRMGPDFASMGLKLNYFNTGLDIQNAGDTRNNQLDVNALLHVGLPLTNVSAFAEAGPSINTNYSGFGYNAGIGGRFTAIELPFLGINGGIMGQYVNVPSEINNNETDVTSTRVMLMLGFELGV